MREGPTQGRGTGLNGPWIGPLPCAGAVAHGEEPVFGRGLMESRYARAVESFEDELDDAGLPLRDRLPDYAAVFGVGLAACVGVGLVIYLISDVSLASSIGYTVVLYGVVFLLAGGASGGGYTNLGIGAAGALFGTRRADEAQDEVQELRSSKPKLSSQERLARGLRPGANPRAFWQVIGGFAYIVLGLVVVVNWS